MKQEPLSISAIRQPPPYKLALQCLLTMLLGASLLLLGACDPGAGDGIDPGVIQIPVAFIKRPIPTDNMGQPMQVDLRRPLQFSQGGDLYLRTNSTTTATVSNITSAVTLGMGDVNGLNASFDGSKLVFSLRLFDPDPNDDVVPRWNIYEYDRTTSQLRAVIQVPSFAEEGDDLFPAYLPDGRIVFSSNRQRQSRAMQINEVKPNFSSLDESEDEISLVLHVMDADGSDASLRQISFNQSHDLNAHVLTRGPYAGQIVFTRWDNAGGNNAMHLYKVNPDGSDLQMIYGRHSHATGTGGSNIQFSKVREMADGRLMVIARPFSGTFDGGDIFIIDVDRYVDIDKPIWSLNGLTGPAQRPATVNNVTTDGSISLDGRYRSAFPLSDGSSRVLVGKSTCQISVSSITRPCIAPWINDLSAVEVSPAYSIWLYDTSVNTEKVVVLAEAGKVISDAIAMQPLPRPPVIFDKGPGQLNNGWLAENLGVVNIKSVYDLGDSSFDGSFFGIAHSAPGPITSVSDFADPAQATAAQRPARFVRFTRAVAIPDPDDTELTNPPDLLNSAFGPQRNRGMREILGYAPVEPDGSVKVKVPANVPLALEVLDGEGRRIGPQHLNWLQVRAGDSITCNGCHTHNTGAVTPDIHARADVSAPSINAGLPVLLQFINTQIPGTTTPYWGNFGDTMAEIRFARVSQTLPLATPEPRLDPDLVYDDYWTDPLVRPADTSYSYRYSDLDPINIPTPLNGFCGISPLDYRCRVTINYPQQIHALWQLDRGADNFTPDPPNAPLAGANGIGDDTCIECHTTSDAMNADRVAAAQLDLSDGFSDIDTNMFKSYRELLFTDQGEELVAGNLVNIQITQQVLDGNGQPIPDGMGGFVMETIDDPTAGVNPTMSVNGARASYFMEKMTETELDAGRTLTPINADPLLYVDHSNMLTGAEKKLVSEWLDLGAQNFNNPFDPAAPQN